MKEECTSFSKIRFVKILLLCFFIVLFLSSCSMNEVINSGESVGADNQNVIQQFDPNNNSEVNVNQAIQHDENSYNVINKFFFQDIAEKNYYIYEGTVWGDDITSEQKPEDIDEEGHIKVRAELTLTEIARLNEGRIFELSFLINHPKISEFENGERVYLWVTEDQIYSCTLNNPDDVISLIKSGEVPKTDQNLIRCSNTSMKFKDAESGLWETEITVNNNNCTYLSSHNSGHFTKFVWEVGKGLTTYSWRYGAMRLGLKLNLAK